MEDKWNETNCCDICQREITTAEYDKNNGLCNDCNSKKAKENLLSLSEINQTMTLLRRISDYKDVTPEVEKSITVIYNFLIESMFK